MWLQTIPSRNAAEAVSPLRASLSACLRVLAMRGSLPDMLRRPTPEPDVRAFKPSLVISTEEIEGTLLYHLVFDQEWAAGLKLTSTSL